MKKVVTINIGLCGGPSSSVGIATTATGWTVRDRIPVATRFSTLPYRLWGPSGLLYNGNRVFRCGKVRPGSAADYSLPSSAGIMEELYLYPTSGPVKGKRYLFIIIIIIITNIENRNLWSVPHQSYSCSRLRFFGLPIVLLPSGLWLYLFTFI